MSFSTQFPPKLPLSSPVASSSHTLDSQLKQKTNEVAPTVLASQAVVDKPAADQCAEIEMLRECFKQLASSLHTLDSQSKQKTIEVASTALASHEATSSSLKTFPEANSELQPYVNIEGRAKFLVSQAVNKPTAYKCAKNLMFLPIEVEKLMNFLKQLLKINSGIIKLLPEFSRLSETDRRSLVSQAFEQLDTIDQSTAYNIASGLILMSIEVEELMEYLKQVLKINPKIIELLPKFSRLSETDHRSLISYAFEHRNATNTSTDWAIIPGLSALTSKDLLILQLKKLLEKKTVYVNRLFGFLALSKADIQMLISHAIEHLNPKNMYDASGIAGELESLPLDIEELMNHLKKLLEIDPTIVCVLSRFASLPKQDIRLLVSHAFEHLDVNDQSAAISIVSGLQHLPLEPEDLKNRLKTLLEITPRVIRFFSKALSETDLAELLFHAVEYCKTNNPSAAIDTAFAIRDLRINQRN